MRQAVQGSRGRVPSETRRRPCALYTGYVERTQKIKARRAELRPAK